MIHLGVILIAVRAAVALACEVVCVREWVAGRAIWQRIKLEDLLRHRIELTARNDAGNAASNYNVVLIDPQGDRAYFSFNSSDFSSSFSSVFKSTADFALNSSFAPTALGNVDFGNIVEWQFAGDFSSTSVLHASVDNIAAVPEPNSLAMMGIGLLGTMMALRRNRKG